MLGTHTPKQAMTLFAVLAAAVLLQACPSDRPAESPANLTRLTDIGQLQDLFVADNGKARMLAILSPN